MVNIKQKDLEKIIRLNDDPIVDIDWLCKKYLNIDLSLERRKEKLNKIINKIKKEN